MDFSKHKLYQKALLGYEIEQFCSIFMSQKDLTGVVQVQEQDQGRKMIVWFNMSNSISCSVVMFESLSLAAQLKQILVDKHLVKSELEIQVKSRIR